MEEELRKKQESEAEEEAHRSEEEGAALPEGRANSPAGPKRRGALLQQTGAIGNSFSIDSPTCQICHRDPPDRRVNSWVIETQGGQILRTVLPIYNRDECHRCHNPEQKINGVLILDYNAGEVRTAMTRDLRWMMAGAFRQAAATALGTTTDEMSNFADIAAAQHGDAVALQHLREFSKKKMATQQARRDSEESSDVSRSGFVGFHPSLERRLKQLDRMGAHVEIASDGHKPWILIAVLSLFLGPFALVAVALLLLLIAIMTMASLVFLTVWMAVIHKLFVVFVHH